MDQKRKLALFMAAGFFVFWLAVLYAGADHPPPPGFMAVIILDLGCSVVVYLRVGTYIDWVKAKRRLRLVRAAVDGLVAGLVIATIMVLIPIGGEPSMPSPGLFDHMIWFSMIALVGMLISMVVYSFTAFFPSKRRWFDQS